MKLNLQAAIDGKLDEQLNIALCEWLGWTHCDPAVVGGPNIFHLKGSGFDTTLPNHITAPESLGLVHEVESTLTTKQQLFYQGNLSIVSGNSKTPGQWYNIHATARQRVIAILQTVKPEIFE